MVLPRPPRWEVVAHGAVGGCHEFNRAGLTGGCHGSGGDWGAAAEQQVGEQAARRRGGEQAARRQRGASGAGRRMGSTGQGRGAAGEGDREGVAALFFFFDRSSLLTCGLRAVRLIFFFLHGRDFDEVLIIAAT